MDATIVAVIDNAKKADMVIQGLRAHVAILKPQRLRLLDLCQALIDGEISKTEAQAAVEHETLIT